MSEISERIVQVIDYLGSNPNSFAKELGYKRSQALYDIIKGKANPSSDFFKKLITSEITEMISVKWLISGIGKMLDTDQDTAIISDNSVEYKFCRSGFCQECILRERLIESMEKTIATMEGRINELTDKKHNK